MDGPFGWSNIQGPKLREVAGKLAEFEKRTWADILGGDSHEILLDSLCKDAKKRLRELKLDDFDHVLSLRLSGAERVICILSNNVAYVLWWDPEHDVCPYTKKHT